MDGYFNCFPFCHYKTTLIETFLCLYFLQAKILEPALSLCQRATQFASIRLSPKKVLPMSVPMKSVWCKFFAHLSLTLDSIAIEYM